MAVPDELGIRRLCDYRFALYAREDLALRLHDGAPLSEMPFVLLSDASRDLPERKWMVYLANGRAPAIETSSTVATRAAIAAGLGVGVLSCYIGDAIPGVTRIEMGPATPREGIYLITHPVQSKPARCRAVADHLVKFVLRHRDFFAGTA